MCGGPALTLFSFLELELLVCGLPHLDFKALERSARYEGGFSAEHPTVRQFWEVLHSLPLDAKKRFLAFTTGSDRWGFTAGSSRRGADATDSSQRGAWSARL